METRLTIVEVGTPLGCDGDPAVRELGTRPHLRKDFIHHLPQRLDTLWRLDDLPDGIDDAVLCLSVEEKSAVEGLELGEEIGLESVLEEFQSRARDTAVNTCQ